MDATTRLRLMTYCRIDADDLGQGGEALLEDMLQGAVAYLEGAGVACPTSGDADRLALYNSCINALVLDEWDNRGSQIGHKVTENPAFRRKLQQLKLTRPAEGG